MIRICTTLAKAGYNVSLVGRELSHSKELSEAVFQQKRFRLLFNQGKLFYLEYNIRLFFYLLFSKWDVVHSVDLDSLLPGYLVAFLKRKTCIYDAHEYFTEVPEVVERPAVKSVWEWVAHFCIPRLGNAITVGESLAEVFQKKYRTRFTVIRNVPFQKPLPEVKSVSEESKRVLLYQGVLNDGRGLEETIEALSDLEDIELWLAGEGDLSDLLRETVNSKGLEKRVKFLGRLSPNELTEVTLKADLGLNLLKNKGLNYYYSLANKAFDYIQAGLPSLNMAFPEYKELNQKHATFLLLSDLKKETIIRGINVVFKENIYNRLSRNCQKASRILTWENEEKKLLDVYEIVRLEKNY